MADDRPGDDVHSNDDGLSSDDLLRQAKRQFGLEDGSSGISASELESSIDDGPEVTADTDAAVDEDGPAEDLASLSSSELLDDQDEASRAPGTMSTDFGDFAGTDISAQASRAPGTASTDFGGTSTDDMIDSASMAPQEPDFDADDMPDSIRFTLPDPGVPTGLPSEPVVVDSDEVLAGLPAPPEATARAGGFIAALWRNRWIVVIAVVGISVLAGLLDNSEPISERAPGDCFNEPSADEVSEIDPIACSDSHELEVFAIVDLPGDAFPGDQALAERAFGDCIERFEGYVGTPYATSALYAYPFVPTRSSWEAGDRQALCVVYEPVPGSDGAEIMSRTGSVRGSGL